MARKRRLHKRYGRHKRNPESYKSNPPLLTDIAEFVGPGFASFAATRFLTRIAAVQLARKKPSWGKHAGAITSIAAFVAAWWGAHRVKFLAKYHTPIVVGSAIAALQSVIQLYIPKLGWMISDASPQLDAESQHLLAAGNQTSAQLAEGIEYLDEDSNEYIYGDGMDAGRTSTTQRAAPTSAAQAKVASDDDLIDSLDLTDEDMDVNLGSLGV